VIGAHGRCDGQVLSRPWGRGLDGDLLMSAGIRGLSVATQVGGVALAIDATADRAANWYEGFGAMRRLDDRLKLVLPLATIAAAAQKRGK
jgi:hypothetical protein